MHQLARAKAGREHGPGHALEVAAVAFGLVDRAGRLEHPPRPAPGVQTVPADGGIAAEDVARLGALALALQEVAVLARDRQRCERRAVGHRGGIDARQRFGKHLGVGLRVSDLARQRGHQGPLALLRRTGFQSVEVGAHHREEK